MADRRNTPGRRREDGMKWCAFNWEAYDRDTGHLAMLQHGAYIQLTSYYYRTQRPLPAAVEQLYRIAGASCDEERDAVDAVLQFFYLDGEVYRHNKIDEELEISRKRLKAKRDAGRIGGQASAQARVKQPLSKSQHSNSNSNSINSKSSVAAAPVDSLHGQIRSQIQTTHEERFKVKCQWDGSEAKALSTIIQSNPSWSVDDFARMIRNRFDSDGVTGTRPRVWLPRLGDWAAGPLDRFNKRKGESNGLGKADNRLRANLERLHRISLGTTDLGSQSHGNGAGELASGGDTGANAKSLDAPVGSKIT